MAGEHLVPGQRVRVRPPPLAASGGLVDPEVLRVPSYLWDRVGVVTACQVTPPPGGSDRTHGYRAVYSVCFTADDLFGRGEHRVTASLDVKYLERVDSSPSAAVTPTPSEEG